MPIVNLLDDKLVIVRRSRALPHPRKPRNLLEKRKLMPFLEAGAGVALHNGSTSAHLRWAKTHTLVILGRRQFDI